MSLAKLREKLAASGRPDWQLEQVYAADDAGLFEISSRTRIEAAGNDAVSFLHRMTTADVQALAVNQGVHGALLNAAGKVLADFYLFRTGDHVLIDAVPGLEKKLIDALSKFVIMEDVKFAPVTGQTFCFLLTGKKAANILENLVTPAAGSLKPLESKEVVLHGGTPCTLTRHELTGDSFAIYGNEPDALAVWEYLSKAPHVHAAGEETYDTFRIKAGVPYYGKDVTEENFLHESRLETAASYTKGCFPGQEIVARFHSFAQPNKKLFGFIIDTCDPETFVGRKIFLKDKEAGWITSSRLGIKGNIVALGYLARSFWEEKHFVVRTPNGTFQLTREDFPL